MSCCGKNRKVLAAQTTRPIAPLSNSAEPGSEVPVRVVALRYIGVTGLAVRGPVTGHLYRFAGRGAKVLVDERDAALFSGIRALLRTAIAG